MWYVFGCICFRQSKEYWPFAGYRTGLGSGSGKQTVDRGVGRSWPWGHSEVNNGPIVGYVSGPVSEAHNNFSSPIKKKKSIDDVVKNLRIFPSNFCLRWRKVKNFFFTTFFTTLPSGFLLTKELWAGTREWNLQLAFILVCWWNSTTIAASFLLRSNVKCLS
jgi:hypothetical protein